jgi:hypothetical protein
MLVAHCVGRGDHAPTLTKKQIPIVPNAAQVLIVKVGAGFPRPISRKSSNI